MSFIDRKTVEYAHTDMAGIVHFSEFFRYMEAAEHAYFRSIGLSVCMPHEGRTISWPRVSCSFDFKGPLRFEDEFEIHLSVEKLGGKSATFRADIVRDEEVLATGRMTSVCCDMSDDGMTPIPIPDDIREKLKQNLTTESSS